MTAWLGKDALTLQLTHREEEGSVAGVAVRLAFEGALESVALEGEEKQLGIHSFLLGNDPSGWRTGVPAYASVLYRGLREGVDLRVREEKGRLEYDVILAPGADLEGVVVRCEGTEGIEVEQDGSLAMATALGPIRQSPPVTWQVLPGGGRTPIEARFRAIGPDRFGFEVPGRDPSLALVVDPGILYSTILGGTSDDWAYAVALDATGAATVAGTTYSSNFPTTLGAYDLTFNGAAGLEDVFVARLSLSGNGAADLVYSTFLGGSGSEYAWVLALDPTGAAIVSGTTFSSNFPTTAGAYDATYNGSGDVFVARLSLSGAGAADLLYSTFLGGASGDVAYALALDATGAAAVAGFTASLAFPTTPGAYDVSLNLADAFVSRLSLSGNGPADLLYSTFLGGSASDEGSGLAFDATGAAIVLGFAGSFSFPTTPAAYDTTFNGGADSFVARLSMSGNGAADLLYSTFLGGSGDDLAQAVALDAAGAATVVGETGSPNFPATPGAYDTTFSVVNSDAFVTRLSLSGNGAADLLYSTFLGGAASGELAPGLALDGTGAATVAGRTASSNFPTTPGAYDTTFSGISEAFVARLSPSGNGAADLRYSTFLGGSAYDEALALALDAAGGATVAGVTGSSGFPTTVGAYDTTFSGGPTAFPESFLARLDLLPAGASAYGASSPGCAGLLAIGVTSWPKVGNAGFAITCGNAPPNAIGFLGLSAFPLGPGFSLLGVSIWIDLGFLLPLPVPSNAIGAALVPIPIPSDPSLAGGQLFAQFFWLGPTAPSPPCPPAGFSASNALALVVQP